VGPLTEPVGRGFVKIALGEGPFRLVPDTGQGATGEADDGSLRQTVPVKVAACTFGVMPGNMSIAITSKNGKAKRRDRCRRRHLCDD